MEVTKDADYTKHNSHVVILESTAIIEQQVWWTPQGGADITQAELVDYVTTQPYELRCWDCELVLTGFDLDDA